jgi:hypothetical protein
MTNGSIGNATTRIVVATGAPLATGTTLAVGDAAADMPGVGEGTVEPGSGDAARAVPPAAMAARRAIAATARASLGITTISPTSISASADG